MPPSRLFPAYQARSLANMSGATIVASDSMIFFFQAADGIRDRDVTGVQTCALPICVSQPIAKRSANRRLERARLGLQNEARTLEPSVRASLCDRLANAGLKRMEAASFVNPKLEIGRASCRERV